MALSESRREQIETLFSEVTIINFNYDRVLQHYLYWALQGLWFTTIEAQVAVAGLDIIPVYGSIGPLEWQAEDGVPFGSNDWSRLDLDGIAKRIFTYTEQHRETDVEKRIHDALEQAALVLFFRLRIPPTKSIDVQTARGRY